MLQDDAKGLQVNLTPMYSSISNPRSCGYEVHSRGSGYGGVKYIWLEVACWYVRGMLVASVGGW